MNEAERIEQIDKEIEELVKSAGNGVDSWENICEDEEYVIKSEIKVYR